VARKGEKGEKTEIETVESPTRKETQTTLLERRMNAAKWKQVWERAGISNTVRRKGTV